MNPPRPFSQVNLNNQEERNLNDTIKSNTLPILTNINKKAVNVFYLKDVLLRNCNIFGQENKLEKLHALAKLK